MQLCFCRVSVLLQMMLGWDSASVFWEAPQLLRVWLPNAAVNMLCSLCSS